HPAFAVATPRRRAPPMLSANLPDPSLSVLDAHSSKTLCTTDALWAQFDEPNTRRTPSMIRFDTGSARQAVPPRIPIRESRSLSAHKGGTVCLIDPRIRSTQRRFLAIGSAPESAHHSTRARAVLAGPILGRRLRNTVAGAYTLPHCFLTH
ncbi:hypothetical protein C8R47DRAFT_1151531, partial [Mycena vitilis]